MSASRRGARLGDLSLLLSVVGAVAAEGALALGWVEGDLFRIVAFGFEAAMIGAVADLFAVRALFHRIPIPLIGRHTDIVVRNRARITRGIVEMVETRWLSPEAIHGRIANLSPVALVLDHLSEAGPRRHLIATVRTMILHLAENLDREEVATFLERALADQIGTVELASPLGRWLDGAIDRGDHERVWEVLIESLAATMREPGMEERLAETFRSAAERYAKGGVMRTVVVNLGEATGGIDYRAAAHAVTQEGAAFVRGALDNPDHPVRVRLDEALLRFAAGLRDGDPATTEIVAAFRDRLAHHADLRPVVRDLLTRFKTTLVAEIESDDSRVTALASEAVDRLLEDLRDNGATRDRLDTWGRARLAEIVEENHAVIGDVVRDSLAPDKLPDRELVAQIEDRVGDDLEYVRLNGAIVGGAVGALIATVRLFFLAGP